MAHKLFGDLSTLHGQFRNLTSTIKAQKAVKVTYDWCNEYAGLKGWGGSPYDIVANSARKNGWQGAPTAEPATRVDIYTSMASRPDDRTRLEITDAILWRAKMTGSGFAKHPTWVGESLLVAALVDTDAGDLAPFSAICQSRLPAVQTLLKSAFGKPGVVLGKTKETRLGDALPPIDDFRLYSAAPDQIDPKIHQQLTAALEGWTGHLRMQVFNSLGLFLAWDWRGDDRARWSADADRAVIVLQQVRNALLKLPPGEPAQVAAKPQSAQVAAKPQARSGGKPKAAQPSTRRQPSQRRPVAPDVTTMEKIALRYSVSKKNGYQQQLFRLPSGMSACVQKWLVQPGDRVVKDQPIVRVTVADDDRGQRQVVLTAPVSGCCIVQRRRVGTELTGRSIVAHVTGTPEDGRE